MPATAMVGFAELAKVPTSVATKLPSVLSIADGALIEPLAISLYGVELAAVRPGDYVLVLGGGTVALYTIYWAAAAGGGEDRRHVALRPAQGSVPRDGRRCLHSIWRQRDRRGDRSAGGSPRIVFECVGAEGMLSKAVMHVAQFGKIVSLGFCTSPDALIPGMASYKCASIQFAVGYSMKEFNYIASQMDKGHCDPKAIITSEVPLIDLPPTMEKLRGPERRNQGPRLHVMTLSNVAGSIDQGRASSRTAGLTLPVPNQG